MLRRTRLVRTRVRFRSCSMLRQKATPVLLKRLNRRYSGEQWGVAQALIFPAVGGREAKEVEKIVEKQ